MQQKINSLIKEAHRKGYHIEFEVSGSDIVIVRTETDLFGEKHKLKKKIEIKISNQQVIVFPKGWEWYEKDDMAYFKKGNKFIGIEKEELCLA